jgi:hypothetical protein
MFMAFPSLTSKCQKYKVFNTSSEPALRCKSPLPAIILSSGILRLPSGANLETDPITLTKQTITEGITNEDIKQHNSYIWEYEYKI